MNVACACTRCAGPVYKCNNINPPLNVSLQAVDVGESMYIHAFGAYFGLAVARVLWSDKYNETRGEGVVYHSDIFSMIGKQAF